MDKSIITRELQILLEAINEQFEIIREYEDFIPQIEFDMIMENVRKLYETFHRLQRLNDPLLFVEKRIAGPQDLKQPAAMHLRSVKSVPGRPGAEPVSASQPLSATENPPQQEALNESKPGQTPGTMQEKNDHTQKLALPQAPPQIPVRPAVKKEMTVKRPLKTTELELFTSEEPVFNIKLKEARERSLGPKVSRHESFKAAIGINDKFMFINELFDGNLRDYNEAIETLGGFKTRPQAQEYLDLLRRRFNWNSGLNAFKRIKELVEGRF